MIIEKIHHVYDSKNRVLAHSLTTEELEEKCKSIQDTYEIVTLEVEDYKESSY